MSFRFSRNIDKNLPQGHTICESDFTVLRPFSGISPMELPHIIGKTLKQDVQEGDAIKLSDF